MDSGVMSWQYRRSNGSASRTNLTFSREAQGEAISLHGANNTSKPAQRPLLDTRSSPPALSASHKPPETVSARPPKPLPTMPTPESEMFKAAKPTVPPTFDGVDYDDNKALKAAQDSVIREQWVQSMMARLVREELGKCYHKEGVNHLQNCAHLRGKFSEARMRNGGRVCGEVRQDADSFARSISGAAQAREDQRLFVPATELLREPRGIVWLGVRLGKAIR